MESFLLRSNKKAFSGFWPGNAGKFAANKEKTRHPAALLHSPPRYSQYNAMRQTPSVSFDDKDYIL